MVATARKVALSSEDLYIQKAMDEGRCTLQEVSMKALGRPDTDYQAREIHLNIDHVATLSKIRKMQGFISPIIVFRIEEKGRERLIIVNGFHRHEEHRQSREPSIRAYVIDGTEQEAREFAAMSNQITLLPRTPADLAKAYAMLAQDKKWFEASCLLVSRHLGCTAEKVKILRGEYCERNQLAVPKEVTTGHQGPWKQKRVATSRSRLTLHQYRDNPTRFYTIVKGQHLEIPREGREEAHKFLKQMEDSRGNMGSDCATDNVRDLVKKNGFPCTSVDLPVSKPGLPMVLRSGRVIFVGTFNRKKDGRFDLGDLHIPSAVGLLLIARQACIKDRCVPVLVCSSNTLRSQGLADLIKGLGIHLLRPDELVEELKLIKARAAPK